MFLAVIKSSTDISFTNCRLVIELFNGEIVIQGGKKYYLGQKYYLTFLRLFLAGNFKK